MPEIEQLSALVEQWERGRASGREIPLEELCRNSPQLVPEVQSRIAALKSFYRELDTDVPSTVPPLRTPSAETGQNEKPSLLQRYELCEEVGRGGMGVVYRGRHRLLNRQVAIKVCLVDHLEERFHREAQLLASVSSPYIVAVHDFEAVSQGRAMLVMDWIHGRNLHEHIYASGGAIEERRALRWMTEVCRGMRDAADCGIVHRDLKPSNILVDHKEQARVADFGIARSPQLGQLTFGSGPMGTPHYMAPEQAEDPRNVDTRADIYSFGATFYHALTGQPPFDGETAFSVLYKHKIEPLVPPVARNQSLSTRTSEIIERCLAKSPVDRFSSFSDLQGVLSTSTVEDPWLADSDPELAPIVASYSAKRDSYLHSNELNKELGNFTLPRGQIIRIVRGNIAEQQVDAIVSSCNDQLSMNSGVSHAIGVRGGQYLRQQAEELAPVRPGRAVVTPGGGLPARLVIHAVTYGIHEETLIRASRDLIAELVNCCFFHADSHKVGSMAFPLLGTRAGQFPADVCLDTMFRSIARAMLRGLTSVRDVRIVIYDRSVAVSSFREQAQGFVKMVLDLEDPSERKTQ